MTNKEAIMILHEEVEGIPADCYDEGTELFAKAVDVAIGALKRDSRVDDITFHWNDEKHNFVAACNAFEDILKVYGRGVS